MRIQKSWPETSWLPILTKIAPSKSVCWEWCWASKTSLYSHPIVTYVSQLWPMWASHLSHMADDHAQHCRPCLIVIRVKVVLTSTPHRVTSVRWRPFHWIYLMAQCTKVTYVHIMVYLHSGFCSTKHFIRRLWVECWYWMVAIILVVCPIHHLSMKTNHHS